ncbi:nucleoside-diphosphate kinase [Sphaerimonospora thailandensis]|uniref:nucleoside-diphosphate kinase n=1 Tax=Sphaerimonospora thailandensis TaxID=795644 RepID=A0A8J3VYM2_9ACTN|nr:nucleoside-diphosphate kinase [Sphaerimonospora thailandensis]GIH69140.1 nucleoside-diphosphate kinase [Sphaerimonospora thailandensis]
MIAQPGIRRAPGGIDWTRWSAILLKPDCVLRGLVDQVLACLAEHVQVSHPRLIAATEQQVMAHYDDMLAPQVSAEFGFDVATDLRRLYVGQQVVVAIANGDNAPARLRTLIGPTDPSTADPGTIRGRFGIDSLRQARARGQLIDNLIHTSDRPGCVARDIGIWYGPTGIHLLTEEQ